MYYCKSYKGKQITGKLIEVKNCPGKRVKNVLTQKTEKKIINILKKYETYFQRTVYMS